VSDTRSEDEELQRIGWLTVEMVQLELVVHGWLDQHAVATPGECPSWQQYVDAVQTVKNAAKAYLKGGEP
jgi:hypothetical protein